MFKLGMDQGLSYPWFFFCHVNVVRFKNKFCHYLYILGAEYLVSSKLLLMMELLNLLCHNSYKLKVSYLKLYGAFSIVSCILLYNVMKN